MSRDNASMRILSPRKRLRGDESLEGTFGATLLNGATCFVLDMEASYRFLKHSVLHADGEHVVMPFDRIGRWVREQGLVGFAALHGGSPDKDLVFTGYKHEQLVQFASSLDGHVVYTGSIPRAATIAAQAAQAEAALVLVVEPVRGDRYVVAGTPESVCRLAVLHPGDKLSLHAAAVPNGQMRASLHVALS